MSLMLPSEALNREFALADTEHERLSSATGDEAAAFEAHGVLVSGIGLLLPAETFAELATESAVCRLPGTPDWFSGIVSVRGNMLPVFDLSLLFMGRIAAEHRTLLILGQGGDAVGFWIDRMPAWVTVQPENAVDMCPHAPPLLGAHTLANYLSDGVCWAQWDVDALFSELGARLRDVSTPDA